MGPLVVMELTRAVENSGTLTETLPACQPATTLRGSTATCYNVKHHRLFSVA